VNGILLLILLQRKVLNGLFEMDFDIQLTDAITKRNAEEGLSLKEDALFILFEPAGGCISAVAFNAVFAELICVVEVTGSNGKNVKAWHEALVLKILGLLPQEIEPNCSQS
jgi:hypothetical protein